MPPFWPGSTADRQSRRAVIAQDIGQWDTPLPNFIGLDQFPNGVGGQLQRDWPNPSFINRDTQARVAMRAGLLSEWNSPLPEFVGQDQFFGGPGQTRDFDWPNPSFAIISRAREAALAQDLGQWDSPLPSLRGLDRFFGGPGQTRDFDWPNPSFSVLARQSTVARTSQTTEQHQGIIPDLRGQDAFFGGPGQTRNFDWPNPSFVVPKTRATQASWSIEYVPDNNPSLAIKSSILPPGNSTADTRVPQSTYINTAKQALVARQAGDVGQLDVPLPVLLPVANPLPPAVQVFDLPTRVIVRANDYSITGSYTLELIAQDEIAGGQLTSLPPRGVARAVDYTWTQPTPLTLGSPVISLPPGEIVLDSLYRVISSKEYGFTYSFPLELIGQDALTVGSISTSNPIAAQRRNVDYTWIQSPTALTFPAATNIPAGIQITDYTSRRLAANDFTFINWFSYSLSAVITPGQWSFDLPSRSVQRLFDCTWIWSSLAIQSTVVTSLPNGDQSVDLATPKPSRGNDATFLQGTPYLVFPQAVAPVGEQFFDSPVRAIPRSVDYTFLGSFQLGDIAQDQFNAGQSWVILPPRGVIRLLDYTWVWSSLLDLSAAPVPIGTQTTELTLRAAPRARDYTFSGVEFQGLAGQDAFNPGVQLSGNAPVAHRRSVDYTWIQSYPLELIGQDQFTSGEITLDQQYRIIQRAFSIYEPGTNLTILLNIQPTGAAAFDLAPRATTRARDYTYIVTPFPGLAGQDQFNPGTQLSGNAPSGAKRASTLGDPGSNQLLDLVALPPVFPYGLSTDLTALPPKAPVRARDYTWVQSFPLELLGQDAFNPGQIISALPSYAVSRARDYTWLQSFALVESPVGQSTEATILWPRKSSRANDYTWLQGPLPQLYGQDAFNAGTQLSGNPPPLPKRAVDYTWISSFPLELNGQDQVNPGVQVLDSLYRVLRPVLSVYEPGTNQALSFSTAQLTPGKVQLDQQFRITPRARDYGFSANVFLGLSGQDQFNPGTQLSGNTPASVRRASTLNEPGSNQLLALVALPPVFPCGLSTDLTVLPPKAPSRARDYTWITSFPLELIGQDAFATGAQTYVLPPISAPRSRDYTWVQSLQLVEPPVGQTTEFTTLWPRKQARTNDFTWIQGPLPQLYGQDALNPGDQIFDLPPKMALRASDYTWIQCFSQLVAQPTPPPGQTSSDLPSRGATRIRDYTWLWSYPLELIGKDQFNPGRQSTDLSPRGPARAVDYTWTQSVPLNTTQFPIPPGQQSLDRPPLRAPRSTDYTWIQVRNQEVIPLGRSTFDLAPRAQPRAVDYTWVQTVRLSSYPFPPIGSQVLELAPRTAPRALDYTWNWAYTLELIGKDQLPSGHISVDLTVPAAPRARDYGWTATIDIQALIVAGTPLNQSNTDMTVRPPYAAPRLLDYTWVGSFGVQARSLHAGQQLYLPDAAIIPSSYSATVVRSSYGTTSHINTYTAKPKDPNR